jgi:hypothetical protein
MPTLAMWLSKIPDKKEPDRRLFENRTCGCSEDKPERIPDRHLRSFICHERTLDRVEKEAALRFAP